MNKEESSQSSEQHENSDMQDKENFLFAKKVLIATEENLSQTDSETDRANQKLRRNISTEAVLSQALSMPSLSDMVSQPIDIDEIPNSEENIENKDKDELDGFSSDSDQFKYQNPPPMLDSEETEESQVEPNYDYAPTSEGFVSVPEDEEAPFGLEVEVIDSDSASFTSQNSDITPKPEEQPSKLQQKRMPRVPRSPLDNPKKISVKLPANAQSNAAIPKVDKTNDDKGNKKRPKAHSFEPNPVASRVIEVKQAERPERKPPARFIPPDFVRAVERPRQKAEVAVVAAQKPKSKGSSLRIPSEAKIEEKGKVSDNSVKKVTKQASSKSLKSPIKGRTKPAPKSATTKAKAVTKSPVQKENQVTDSPKPNSKSPQPKEEKPPQQQQLRKKSPAKPQPPKEENNAQPKPVEVSNPEAEAEAEIALLKEERAKLLREIGAYESMIDEFSTMTTDQMETAARYQALIYGGVNNFLESSARATYGLCDQLERTNGELKTINSELANAIDRGTSYSTVRFSTQKLAEDVKRAKGAVGRFRDELALQLDAMHDIATTERAVTADRADLEADIRTVRVEIDSLRGRIDEAKAAVRRQGEKSLRARTVVTSAVDRWAEKIDEVDSIVVSVDPEVPAKAMPARADFDDNPWLLAEGDRLEGEFAELAAPAPADDSEVRAEELHTRSAFDDNPGLMREGEQLLAECDMLENSRRADASECLEKARAEWERIAFALARVDRGLYEALGDAWERREAAADNLKAQMRRGYESQVDTVAADSRVSELQTRIDALSFRIRQESPVPVIPGGFVDVFYRRLVDEADLRRIGAGLDRIPGARGQTTLLDKIKAIRVRN